jgi:thiol-disulfide isomerase/thioredoxin
MDAIRLGPLYLPIAVALSLAAVLAATLVAEWFRRRRGIDPGGALWNMIVAGFVSARLVFVLKHHAIYLAAPLSVFDIRDGGFSSVAGLIAACVVGAELTRRQAALRRPVLACMLAGCAVWFGGTLLNQALTPAHTPLPDVMVRQLDGREVALRSFADRPVVLNLWATWCPPCRREMPALLAAQAQHPDVAFVLVNQGESAAVVTTYVERERLRLPAQSATIVLDPGSQVAAHLGAAGMPTTLFYDAAGHLRTRHVGELSPATLADKLAAVRP